MTERPEPYSAVVMAILAICFCAWALLTLPIQGAAILTTASVLAYGGWITFSYTRPVKSRKVIAVYLCAVGFQLIHMAEEYTGDFPHEIVELFDSPRDWPEREFLLVFVFGFGALYFFAGAGALYRIRVSNFFLWWYALGAGLLNGISHFVFPIIKGGYFPGLYTAGGHFIMSALLIYFLVTESRRLEAADRLDGRPLPVA
ncbi:HXXEE domain-containing protein [Nocardia pneumoniae]|uniref:HXXEE domain-containing protein n=1 Tax=Nocardia pneumoniae TaxID=228601 RepID=UPI0002E39B4F|nr:HXXEE domain-containing protein [Nocardia pneumoniae]